MIAGLLKRAVWPGDDPTWERMFGNYAEPVSSNVTVDETTAYNFSVFWAGVQIIGGTLASLPLPLYRRLDNDGKKKAPDHPLYRILHDEPHPYYSSYTFRETMQSHVLTWGNAYAGINRDTAGGMPKALVLFDPARMEVKWDDATKAPFYEYRRTSGEVARYGPDQVFHVRGLSDNGFVGRSLISAARESLGLGLAMEKFGASFYGQAAVPPFVLELAPELSKKGRENLRRSLTEEHADWKGKRRPMILEGGTTWKSISISQEDAEFIASRRFTVEEWARWFNLPVHLLREMTNSSVRANIEQESLEYVLYTMRPWAVRWEQEISRQLIPESDRETYFAEFNFDGLLRGDAATRSEGYFKGLQTGRYSVNDILRLENQNPIGPEGDKRFIPMNLIPLDKVDEQIDASITPAGSPEGGKNGEKDAQGDSDDDTRAIEPRKAANTLKSRLRIRAAHERLFIEIVTRSVTREIKAIRSAVKRYEPTDDIAGWMEWMRVFYAGSESALMANLSVPVASLADAIFDSLNPRYVEGGWGGDNLDELHVFVQEYAKRAATRYVGSAVNQFEAVSREMERDVFWETVLAYVEQWATYRASWIGRNETNRAANALARETFRMLGIRRLKWVSRCEKGAPCQTLNGRIVNIGEKFTRRGDILTGGDKEYEVKSDRYHPPLRDGCLCQIEAEL